ncbi:MAG: TonB-dependent receptor, partial [Sphingobacteriaceae bacterium]
MSQTKSEYSVSGIVVDSLTKKPVDYITISLKDDKNVAVKAALSKSDGSFNLTGLKPLKYSLSVVGVGFNLQKLDVDLSDSSDKHTDLGVIYLVKSTNKLKEVVITGEKPIMTQEIDRISYNLQADPESKGSNVLEMMRKVPLLSLDAEDNIQLKGDKNFKILINGKPSSMVERNPRDILRSMPASTIEKIEVITTPPAKYDADGLAGIINIITNKKIDNGYNASLNISERFPVGGPGMGGSFTVKQGKFGISGYGGGSIHNSPLTNNANSRLSTFTTLSQNGTNESDSRSGYFGSELSIEIDSLNLISGQFNINGNKNEGNSNQQSLLRKGEEITQSYHLGNSNTGKASGLDLALNYQLGFKSNKSRLFTVSYRYFNYGNDQFNELVVTDPVDYDEPNYKQKNHGITDEHTFQIDYVHPVKKITIEAGIKGIIRNNKSDFRYDSLNTEGVFQIDNQQSNNFENQQRVLAIYNSYQYNLKDWGFKGGLRLEQTIIDADFISTSSLLKKNYLNLVPSISINRKLKNMSSLTLGYSYRVKRPGIRQLNPFVDRSNPNIESSGNPDLRPASGSSIELKYSKFKKGSFNVGLSYEFFNHLVMPMSTLDPVTNITRSTFGNTGRARLIATNANVNYPITKKLNITVNGYAALGKVNGLVNNEEVSNEGLMYYVSGS